MLELATERLPAVNNGLFARRSWVSDNRVITQRNVGSIVEDIARAKTDRALALGLMKKCLEQRTRHAKALAATYDYDADEGLRIPPVTAPEQFHNALTQLAAKNPKANGFDVRTILDTHSSRQPSRAVRGKGASGPSNARRRIIQAGPLEAEVP